jgi:hypothetical protein
VTFAAANAVGGTGHPVFNAADVAGVMNGTPQGQALLARLKSDFVVKAADVYSGKDANDNLGPEKRVASV